MVQNSILNVRYKRTAGGGGDGSVSTSCLGRKGGGGDGDEEETAKFLEPIEISEPRPVPAGPPCLKRGALIFVTVMCMMAVAATTYFQAGALLDVPLPYAPRVNATLPRAAAVVNSLYTGGAGVACMGLGFVLGVVAASATTVSPPLRNQAF